MGSAGEGRELPSLQKYIQYIRDHFGTLPGSASYYSLLEEFLCKGGRAGLQEIKCVELRPLLGDSTNDTPAICPVEFNSRGDEPRVCVLEGFPSPECIAALANRYRVRPELLIGHLDLEHMTTSKHCSQMLPTVPSRRRNIVHIHLITLGRFSPSSISNRTMEELVKKRLIVNEEVNTYQERLFTDRRFGETRYRRVHIHNSQFFSFEQMVSFSVSNTDTMGNTLWNGTRFPGKIIFITDSVQPHFCLIRVEIWGGPTDFHGRRRTRKVKMNTNFFLRSTTTPQHLIREAYRNWRKFSSVPIDRLFIRLPIWWEYQLRNSAYFAKILSTYSSASCKPLHYHGPRYSTSSKKTYLIAATCLSKGLRIVFSNFNLMSVLSIVLWAFSMQILKLLKIVI